MKPGETIRYTCGDCNTEMEITLEPKAKGDNAAGLKPQVPDYCPFCGAQDLVGDADPVSATTVRGMYGRVVVSRRDRSIQRR